jgi:hypothetical protein
LHFFVLFWSLFIFGLMKNTCVEFFFCRTYHITSVSSIFYLSVYLSYFCWLDIFLLHIPLLMFYFLCFTCLCIRWVLSVQFHLALTIYSVQTILINSISHLIIKQTKLKLLGNDNYFSKVQQSFCSPSHLVKMCF